MFFFKCGVYQIHEMYRGLLSMIDEKSTGLRLSVSVSSLTSEEEQRVVTCDQVHIKKSFTENVNGDCKLMRNPTRKVVLNPAALDNYNSNNNNNNHYQGGWIHQDAGTEIAFVLDGSGSIEPDDFQRAKDFIYNVMSNCDFAIVQYGSRIRTELSLLDSKNHATALQKIKEIQQLGNLTKTASAIHHVLTDIFIPENGSKNNSKKIIIVLSDGEILGDAMKLTDVLNMPQMKSVVRYSVGVGDGILKKPRAVQEMKEIADPDQFVSVSDYASLDDIRSSLEQNLIEDAAREIAFVLDGSGSIQPDDFQRAKDFIYNVISNCDFAIVQYGSRIRTELSLLDSKNHSTALQKVKEIQQLGMITKTASAIHHVLTDTFIPENGSKKKSKKMIIVLSDGEILGDPMKLTDVLNMPQMKGVTRYSIGVGDGILKKPTAIKEMMDIADHDKFFNVSNYAALDDILSSLGQSLIGIKDVSSHIEGGQEDDGVDEKAENVTLQDAGTEIAFVLDGSDSIQHNDFKRSKDFIYNVMSNVWKACFNASITLCLKCDFVIVQYGKEIRTELSLLDSKNHARAFQKVKEIQQIFSIARTASAIHHVLTDIFIPQNGSKMNSKKIIIVLSDGQMSGDPMNLADVLNMPQMKGVIRFSIGVGEGILSNPQAVQEMREIADPDKFYTVYNHSALEDILSLMDQTGTDFHPPAQFTKICVKVSVFTTSCDKAGVRLSQLLGDYQIHKMYRGLLFMIVIWSVTGFNIHITPVKNFTNDDPLFGQIIIQSKDGVFVPSPKTGKLFRCTLENECNEVNSDDKKPTGLRPVASVSSLTSSKKEQLVMMCNQVRVKKSVTEDLNGDCKLMNDAGKVIEKPNLVALDCKFLTLHFLNFFHLSKNNNNNNNNRYQGRWIGQDQLRMRRDILSIPEAIQEMTQIIDPGKFFSVSNYATLDDIRASPEQGLIGAEVNVPLPSRSAPVTNQMEKEKLNSNNNNHYYQGGRIDKVKRRRRRDAQLDSDTDEDEDDDAGTEIAFVLDGSGSIHADDFQRAKDFMYNVMSNCNFAIVQYGSRIRTELSLLDNENGARSLQKVKEIQQIFNLTKTASAIHHVGDGILTKPKAIQEMKDIADRGKFYNVSSYAALDDILSSLQQSLVGIEAGFSSHFMQDNSYLFGAVGAYDWSGGVILQSDKTVKFLNDSNNGPKFSYLGYSVTSASVNQGKTLYISGAPRYNLTGGVFIFDDSEHKYVLHGDQVGSYFGSVLCALDIDRDKYTDYLLVGAPHFHRNGEEGKVLVYRFNQGDAGQTFARFGAAIASIGDIDGNSFNDVAVGAPLETDSSGSIYIYNGFKEGLRFSQKISPSDFGMKLVHFGQSVSGVPATTSNKASIAVGSQGGVFVFETIPVMVIKPAITITPDVIPLDQQVHEISSKFEIKFGICFNVIKGKLENELPILYQIDLDSGANKKRLTADSKDPLTETFILKPDTECTSVNLKYLISFKKDCTDCKPEITLSDSKISETLIIIGETQSLNLNINLVNTQDPSYMTTLTLTFPSILSQRKIEGATCPVKNDNQIECNLQHPIFKRGAQTNLFISWQINNVKSELKNSEIIANLTSTASPNRLRIEEGEKGATPPLNFSFQFAGENKYGAAINVVVNITKNTLKTDLKIISVEPKEECDFQENTKEGSNTINCTMTKLQEILIITKVSIHDVQGKSDKITAVGTYSFDEKVYAAKNTSRTIPVEVIISKLQVTTSTGPIIGGSIGGFLLLFIIIIVLIKVKEILLLFSHIVFLAGTCIFW
ncbi:Integrin alpha-E [Labeo rohita]|uniref:Integrin alpha-E n=1 Tax=Labeo rohita TaxID=84645 RepID=A0ABQ8M1W6_LABRO|nr:Integrin alpha-E [Labeo rohita]